MWYGKRQVGSRLSASERGVSHWRAGHEIGELSTPGATATGRAGRRRGLVVEPLIAVHWRRLELPRRTAGGRCGEAPGAGELVGASALSCIGGPGLHHALDVRGPPSRIGQWLLRQEV